MGFPEILDRVQRNDPALTTLIFDRFTKPPPHLDDWESFGHALSHNTNVKRVEFRGELEEVFEDHGVEYLCGGMIENKSIEDIAFVLIMWPLQLENCFKRMSYFFENNVNLKSVEITKCKISFEACAWIGRAFSKCTSLKEVRIDFCPLIERKAEMIITSLMGMTRLEQLLFRGNRIGNVWQVPGWQATPSKALAKLLNNPRVPLTKLCIGKDFLVDKDIYALSAGLAHNNTLESLDLNYNKGVITPLAWASLIIHLRFSNHTLKEILFDGVLPRELEFLLKLNEMEDKRALVIRKGLYYNFIVGKHDACAYHDLDPNLKCSVLPCILATINSDSCSNGRSERDRRSALFHFIRNMPLEVTQFVSK